MKAFLGGLIILMTFFSGATYAGGVYVGNGGNVISCEGVPGLRFLDAYLSQTQRAAAQGPVAIGPKNFTLWDRVNLLLEPIRIVAPEKASLYGSWLLSFFDEIMYVSYLDPQANFPNNRDDIDLVTKSFLRKNSCQTDLVIFQVSEVMNTGTRYMVVLDYWRQLTSDEQAIAVLHEILLRDFKQKYYYKIYVQRLVSEMIYYARATNHSDKEYFLSLIRENLSHLPQ